MLPANRFSSWHIDEDATFSGKLRWVDRKRWAGVCGIDPPVIGRLYWRCGVEQPGSSLGS